MRVKKYFTLVELVVVIVIISVLAVILTLHALQAIEKAKVSRAVADMRSIKSAIGALYADTGQWPGAVGHILRPDLLSFWVRLSNEVTTWPTPGPQVYESGLMQNDSGAGAPLPGWDGPYLEKISARYPWGGTLVLYVATSDGGGIPACGNTTADYAFVLANYCYNSLNLTQTCGIPPMAGQRMNQIIDKDSELST